MHYLLKETKGVLGQFAFLMSIVKLFSGDSGLFPKLWGSATTVLLILQVNSITPPVACVNIDVSILFDSRKSTACRTPLPLTAVRLYWLALQPFADHDLLYNPE